MIKLTNFPRLFRLTAIALTGAFICINVGCESAVPAIDIPTAANGQAEVLVFEPETKSVNHVEKTFREAIDAPGKTIVVDFWAPWCPPCRKLGPELEEVAKELAGEIVIVKIDVDENSELAQMFNVSGIPDVRFFKDGKAVGGFGGFKSADQVVSLLKQ